MSRFSSVMYLQLMWIICVYEFITCNHFTKLQYLIFLVMLFSFSSCSTGIQSHKYPVKMVPLRDTVLVQSVQFTVVLVSCGFLVQVAEVLHSWHAALGSLLWDVQLLHKLQCPWALVGELVRAAVMTLRGQRGANVLFFLLWRVLCNLDGGVIKPGIFSPSAHIMTKWQ